MPDPTSPSSPDEPRRPLGRRAFFRNGLRELLRPVVESIDERIAEIAQALPPGLKSGDAASSPRSIPLAVLRPPGAQAEPDFLATCSRCGACVTACPADAIRIDSTAAIGGGAPYIDADVDACVVCTTLECMMVCPTGALVPTPIRGIDMGTAVWRPGTCVRTHGQDCRICVDECPIGEVAIRLDASGHVQVIEDGCVGCGVCQNRCPTTPKSIVVNPRDVRDAMI